MLFCANIAINDVNYILLARLADFIICVNEFNNTKLLLLNVEAYRNICQSAVYFLSVLYYISIT